MNSADKQAAAPRCWVKAAACGRDDTTESENPEGGRENAAQNRIHQWDICNQEDLDIFSAESLEIDQSAARTLYRTDTHGRPGTEREKGRRTGPESSGGQQQTEA